MLKPKSASAYVGLHNSLANDFVATIHRLRDKDGVIDDLLPHLYKFAMEGQILVTLGLFCCQVAPVIIFEHSSTAGPLY